MAVPQAASSWGRDPQRTARWGLRQHHSRDLSPPRHPTSAQHWTSPLHRGKQRCNVLWALLPTFAPGARPSTDDAQPGAATAAGKAEPTPRLGGKHQPKATQTRKRFVFSWLRFPLTNERGAGKADAITCGAWTERPPNRRLGARTPGA